MEFTFEWIFEFMLSFILPFVIAYDFYRKHAMHKTYLDIFCRKSMPVAFVAGLSGLLILYLLQIHNLSCSQKYVYRCFGFMAVMYVVVGYLVGFIFVVFGKRTKS